MLDVRQLADRRARLAAGRDAVGMRERADRAADRVDQQVAVALAPLIYAAEDGRRPLAGAADAHHVAPQLGIGVDHLREHVVGGVERDLHALHRRRRHGGGEVRAVERAGRGIELDVTKGAADRVVLLPAHQLVQRHHDGAAPAGVGGIDGAGLGVGPLIFKYEFVSIFIETQDYPVHAAIARPAALHVSAIAPYAIRQPGYFLQKSTLAII